MNYIRMIKVLMVLIYISVLSCENNSNNKISNSYFFKLAEKGYVKNVMLINQKTIEFTLTDEGCHFFNTSKKINSSHNCEKSLALTLDTDDLGLIKRKMKNLNNRREKKGFKPILIKVIEQL